jgi:hypothetical protein
MVLLPNLDINCVAGFNLECGVANLGSTRTRDDEPVFGAELVTLERKALPGRNLDAFHLAVGACVENCVTAPWAIFGNHLQSVSNGGLIEGLIGGGWVEFDRWVTGHGVEAIPCNPNKEANA